MPKKRLRPFITRKGEINLNPGNPDSNGKLKSCLKSVNFVDSFKCVTFNYTVYVKEFASKKAVSSLLVKNRKRNRRERKAKSIQVHQYFPEIRNQEIHNLSKYKPSELEKAVLSLGLNYIPEPTPASKLTFLQEFDDFADNIRRRKRLVNIRNDPKIITSNVAEALNSIKKPVNISTGLDAPFKSTSPLEEYLASTRIALEKSLADLNPLEGADQSTRKNVLKAVKSLKSNSKIVIKPSDKNLGVCIMDYDFYVDECYRQLNDVSSYKKYDSPPDFKGIMTLLKRILFINNQLYSSENQLSKVATFLLQPLLTNTFKIGKFYILPKIHKSPIVGRPIVNCIDTITSFASRLLDKLLQPIMVTFGSYIKDSNQLVLQLSEIKFNRDVIFMSADIVNLYPSIDINAGIQELSEALKDSRTDNLKFILDLTRWTLEHNFLTFDKQIFKQIKGVAMGQSVAVAFACIYISMIEIKCLKKCHRLNSNFQYPVYFKRFIDDIFSVWKTTADAEFFISEMNNMHPNIKLTSSISASFSIFLDVQVYKGPQFSHSNFLDIALYQKPINKYQYIPYSSYHTKFIFKSFITSELNRYLVKCTNPLDFLNLRRLFFQRLTNRGYNKRFLENIFKHFPVSTGDLQKLRLARLASLQKSYFGFRDKSNKKIPLLYKSRYNPLHSAINLRQILEPVENCPILFDPDWTRLSNNKNPIVCYLNNKSLAKLLL